MLCSSCVAHTVHAVLCMLCSSCIAHATHAVLCMLCSSCNAHGVHAALCPQSAFGAINTVHPADVVLRMVPPYAMLSSGSINALPGCHILCLLGMQDSATFLLLSLGINLIAFLSFLPQTVKFQIPSIDILYQLLGTVLNALPPQLMSMLVILKVVTVARLRQGSILLSDIQKLQTAAQLDVVLFDKTGTLTVGQVRSSQCHCSSIQQTRLHVLQNLQVCACIHYKSGVLGSPVYYQASRPINAVRCSLFFSASFLSMNGIES